MEGIKYDEGKLRYDLLPPDSLDAVVEVFTFGANKYTDRNWERGMAWGRLFGALMRHCWAFWRGEDFDKESGLHHLAHAGSCIFILLAHAQRNIGKDNRNILEDKS